MQSKSPQPSKTPDPIATGVHGLKRLILLALPAHQRTPLRHQRQHMSLKPAVAFVLASVFLDALGIGIIIPVLPRLVGTLTETPDLQTIWYGAIMVSYGLMQFFSAPVIGAISDRIGRRPVLLAGIAGLGIMMFAPALCDSLWLILFSRILAGTMSSNIVVAQAYIADVTPAGQRTAAFGRIGAIFGIAFILGPALGGLLGENNPRLPFYVAGSICVLNFLYGLFVLPESLTTPSRSPITLTRINPFSALAALSKERLVLPLLFVVMLYTLSQSLMQCTWALYTEFRYGWTPAAIGFSIFALGCSITVVQGYLLSRLTNRFSTRRLVLGGLACGIISFLCIGFSPIAFPAAIAVCAVALMGIVGPILQGVISRTGSPYTQGVRLGAMSSINSFTGAISPLIGTPLLFFTSSFEPDSLAAGTPFFLCALIVAVALILSLRFPLPEETQRYS